jgi:hypothetical protein
MADGGLLKKAMEQKTEDVIEADIKFESDVKGSENVLSKLGSNSMKLGLFLALIGLISGFITANPQLQQEYSLAIFIPISLLSASFFFLWNTFDRKMTGAIGVFCILLLATPYGITSLNTSSLTIVDDELSDDSSEIILKVRESGSFFGSSDGPVDITVKYDGDSVWSGEVPFSVDREDGIGNYGFLSLNVADFYSGNAVPEVCCNNNGQPLIDGIEYVIEFSLGNSDLTYILSASSLQRTIEEVQSDAIGSIGFDNDCNNGKETCIVGIGLRSWSGLESIDSSSRPGGMAFSDYDIRATLYYENIDAASISIDYPDVSVVNGEASWNSMNGIYGSGTLTNVGDFGSELPLDGSIEDTTIGMKYIPVDEMEINDYGCYIFEVITSQGDTWQSMDSLTSITYYEFAEGEVDNGQDSTEEYWEKVNSC